MLEAKENQLFETEIVYSGKDGRGKYEQSGNKDERQL